MSLKYEPSSEPQAAVMDVHITRMATAKIADRSTPLVSQNELITVFL